MTLYFLTTMFLSLDTKENEVEVEVEVETWASYFRGLFSRVTAINLLSVQVARSICKHADRTEVNTFLEFM